MGVRVDLIHFRRLPGNLHGHLRLSPKTPPEEQCYETFLCGRSLFDDNGKY